MRIEIRNKNNLLIGWVQDLGDAVQAFHIKKGFCGRYSKNSNITFDKQGRIYCYGDGTQSLVREADVD